MNHHTNKKQDLVLNPSSDFTTLLNQAQSEISKEGPSSKIIEYKVENFILKDSTMKAFSAAVNALVKIESSNPLFYLTLI